MTGDIDTNSRTFLAKVKRKASKFGLRIEKVDAEQGVVAPLGDELLVVFTEEWSDVPCGCLLRRVRRIA